MPKKRADGHAARTASGKRAQSRRDAADWRGATKFDASMTSDAARARCRGATMRRNDVAAK
ncbi:hypothetical protein WT60_26205 [Burkholderia sp. MSMB617WGS]|uniref:Uncharacterized protein n=1 Tax=Burkholderia savannae TaxID=1637837 RepID=A0ABR5T5N0_9BURK|nr:hypothetical protein WS78_24055 [Burkholderia savannae]AOK50317.1 hypothetical protein WT60_26205 [Burkholderia sp. MSMB617WGS]KVG44758.1 hypothetical protein WS77_08485 [Burkholderia sp. MSMB0265]KVG86688.1 hypothetical protein WS81_28865 [Burkholderia sp. MSMB2040]KVG91515.1 hypothetical protein WS82_14425 [Burkholderia sp. MSMB2041]KVG97774.1 hypothetical protein WS83_29980 [Burkholderia sp. MSMB2042]KVK83586.1 hypothetical protein WS91_06485 [Burkholderia sp. MSMB1498]